ncbi:histone deacetylase family protein [Aquicella lusitana]|uniref:Acetoin utilization deacetylase AcuC-like enzyme n=1 Tax=Aquicella lusitana TaxID=254246 RepID=A0A370GN51_9COXI|nr:histone deacetylase family protein [Aquicella lusitana]RDI45162.1 acetoin utilization deacetylase AcuC-like enzyme [Aquicella lusitana]VVC72768.1 Histone deacetylase-like amidohydrolase [Aquicella lusitana]
MTLNIISHPDCMLHEAGEQHPERPARVEIIQKALARYPFKVPATFLEAPLATREQLLGAHEKTYVDWIFSIAPKEGYIAIDADTWMNPYTLNAALRAAGSVVFAVDRVMQNQAQAVFCNVRPPGHHAEKDTAMGFCFFNNVAVGVIHAMKHHHLKRVAIIDFDVHHGNGTQNIFQQNEHVLYCSSFEHPFYPGYDEEMDNPHLLAVPLSAGTSGDVFREKVQTAWFDKLAAFKPQLIFFSAGFDAHTNDPLADLHLTEADYVWLTKRIADMAKNHCQGRMISVLEGGYNLEVLAQCVPAHVNAMIV